MSDTKYFAAHYVAFKDNLTEDEKGSLIKWFKEAPDNQIKSFLIRGDYEYQQEAVDIFNEGNFDNVFKMMDEPATKDILKHKVKKIGVTGGLGAAVIAAVIVTSSYQIYKRFLSKAARSCSNKGGAEKTLCMVKYKKEAMRRRISQLQKGISACSKSKNPAKCKNKVQIKIKSLRSKLT